MKAYLSYDNLYFPCKFQHWLQMKDELQILSQLLISSLLNTWVEQLGPNRLQGGQIFCKKLLKKWHHIWMTFLLIWSDSCKCKLLFLQAISENFNKRLSAWLVFSILYTTFHLPFLTISWKHLPYREVVVYNDSCKEANHLFFLWSQGQSKAKKCYQSQVEMCMS